MTPRRPGLSQQLVAWGFGGQPARAFYRTILASGLVAFRPAGRGVAATRLHGISTSRQAAASPRSASTEYPRQKARRRAKKKKESFAARLPAFTRRDYQLKARHHIKNKALFLLDHLHPVVRKPDQSVVGELVLVRARPAHAAVSGAVRPRAALALARDARHCGGVARAAPARRRSADFFGRSASRPRRRREARTGSLSRPPRRRRETRETRQRRRAPARPRRE